MRNNILLFSLLLLAGCEETLEQPLTDKKVTLLAPANHVISSDPNQLFYWEPLEDAVKYQLQVVSPRFDSIVRLAVDTIITKNQFPLNLPAGDYEWRVKAINYSSNSILSDSWHLKIQ